VSVRWIIQENLWNEEGFNALLRALDVIGSPYTVVKVVPFAHDLIPEPTVAPEERVIAVGAYTMTKIAKARGWSPGVWLNDNFDYKLQVEKWGRRVLNHDASFYTFEDHHARLWMNPPSGSFFVRPLNDEKSFAGMVTTWSGFSQWFEAITNLEDLERSEGYEPSSTLTSKTRMAIAPVKTILREYRVWIVKGKVVTSSLYKSGAQVLYDARVDPDVIEFAEKTAAIWSPADAYVMDVAHTPDGLRVIEVNCINSAGFYAGNVGKLVQALEDLVNVS
jgi:hypothetical protein